MSSPPQLLVIPCTRVRSTLLVGSLQALRTRGHGAAYLAQVRPEIAAVLSGLGAPQWLPVGVAEAHYGACDALGLKAEEVLAIGALTAPTQASGVKVILQAARTTGVTPWTALANAPRYWSRMYDGSALRVVKNGPKDALLEVEANVLARFAYWRTGLRGIIGGLARLLSTYALARELAPAPALDAVTYSLSWV